MPDLAPARRPGVVSAVFVLIAVAVPISLGVWQVQRLGWKTALLAHIAAARTAPARPLQNALRSGDADYVRVSFQCPDLMSRPRLRLYGVQDGKAGYRMMTACPIDISGVSSILVDLGFQPQSLGGESAVPACAKAPPAAPFSQPAIGVLRLPDKPTFVTPPNQPAQNLWYSRDLPAMAKALSLDRPAPAFVALEAVPGARPNPCDPTPTPLPLDIPNRHLEYALTWFGLAAVVAGVYVAMLFRKRID